MGKALVQKKSSNDEVDALRRKVQAIFAEHALRDSQDIDSLNRYADFSQAELEVLVDAPIGDLKAHGLSRRAARIALMGHSTTKNVPYAVKALQERSLARIRRVDDAEGLVKLGFAIGQLPPRAPRRDDKDVITVEATEVR